MTKDEYVEWKENSVTKEIILIMKEVREAYKEKLASGATIDSITNTARTVGNIEAFDYLINIEWEETNVQARGI